MKLCKNCKWMREPGKFAKCVAPQNMRRDTQYDAVGFPDTTMTPKFVYCSTQRGSGWDAWILGVMIDSCGNGRWFVPNGQARL